jgi:hypothetical protein
LEPEKMDAILALMALDELEEALDLVVSWERDGTLSRDEAAAWQTRIQAWVDYQDHPTDHRYFD